MTLYTLCRGQVGGAVASKTIFGQPGQRSILGNMSLRDLVWNSTNLIITEKCCKDIGRVGRCWSSSSI